MSDQLDLFVNAVIEHHLQDLHTMLPAKIISIDYGSQKATVQPLIKNRDRDGSNNKKGLYDLPLIQNVPVQFPSAGTGIITFPVKVGDQGMLVFCEKSLDTFLTGDGATTADPQDFRKHDYNDAVMVMGVYPFGKAIGIDPNDTVIKMNAKTGTECTIKLKANGDVEVNTTTKLIVNATNEVTVNTATANINASNSVTIDSPQTTCTGELRVDGGVSIGSDVQTDAGFSGNNHKHLGNLAKPTSVFLP